MQKIPPSWWCDRTIIRIWKFPLRKGEKFVRTGLAFENQRNNPLPSLGDGIIIFFFTFVGGFFTFYEEIRNFFFCGTWDCHNRMRKEKLPGIFPCSSRNIPWCRLTDWVSTPRSPPPSLPPTHTRAFSGPKKQVPTFQVPKSKWGVGGRGRRLQPCLPRSFFFFFLPCPGILPGPACDRAREVCGLRRSCASAASRQRWRRRRGSVAAQIHAAVRGLNSHSSNERASVTNYCIDFTSSFWKLFGSFLWSLSLLLLLLLLLHHMIWCCGL